MIWADKKQLTQLIYLNQIERKVKKSEGVDFPMYTLNTFTVSPPQGYIA